MLSASISSRGYSGEAQRLSRVKGEHLVDLPTYTSIWRIEKRLYKLYDFRLPMPLPIGQVTVFVAIAVPYVVLLTMLGLPFNHTLIWLYILPPGLATWLVTRPVLESKRLPELIRSQWRYLAEPRVLCRMALLTERDVVVVTGRVWRPRAGRPTVAAAAAAQAEFGPAQPPGEAAEAPAWTRATDDVPARPGRRRLGPGRSRAASAPAATPAPAAATPAPAAMRAAARAMGHRHRYSDGDGPSPAVLAAAARAGAPAPPAACPAAPITAAPPAPAAPPVAATPAGPPVAAAPAAAAALNVTADLAVPADPPVTAAVPAGPPPQRPVVTVVTAGPAGSAPPSVERALAGPAARRGDVRAGRVTVVPGGDRPGKPDQLHRDRTRAQLPVGRPARVVVLGCTVGAGQTTTALLTGEVLASLRSGQVAVLDLNPSLVSLATRAEVRPALSQAAMLAPSRLVVVPPRQG